MEDDTFMLEKMDTDGSLRSVVKLQTQINQDANAFCTKLDKRMEPVKFEVTDSFMLIPGNVSLRFRCVRNRAPGPGTIYP